MSKAVAPSFWAMRAFWLKSQCPLITTSALPFTDGLIPEMSHSREEVIFTNGYCAWKSQEIDLTLPAVFVKESHRSHKPKELSKETKTYCSIKWLCQWGPRVIVNNAELPLSISMWNVQDSFLAIYLSRKKCYLSIHRTGKPTLHCFDRIMLTVWATGLSKSFTEPTDTYNTQSNQITLWFYYELFISAITNIKAVLHAFLCCTKGAFWKVKHTTFLFSCCWSSTSSLFHFWTQVQQISTTPVIYLSEMLLF